MKKTTMPILGLSLFLVFNSFHSMANSLSYDELYHKSKQMVKTNAAIISEANSLKTQNDQLQLDNAYMSRKILKIGGELTEKDKKYQALYSEHESSKEKFLAAEQLAKSLLTNIKQFLEKTAPKESLNLNEYNKNAGPSDKVDYLSLLSKELKETPSLKSPASNSTKRPQALKEPFYGVFSKSGKPIRNRPTVQSSILGITSKGQIKKITNKYLSWYQLEEGGWVHKSLISKK